MDTIALAGKTVAGEALAASGSVTISFDVEEHYRIEAAAGLGCSDCLKEEYAARMEATTQRLLDLLAEAGVLATFFIVGEIGDQRPALVRAISQAGHEIASHSHRHQRIHRLTPQQFREDVLASKDALEQASGRSVVGFRAPTFSIDRQTAWAVDILAECGFLYDSSVFPVYHDRYGVPEAPRTPYLLRGPQREILELPPATYRIAGQNLPIAGGGYFRLFPSALMHAGLRQILRHGPEAVGMLYFHPWEFDPQQPRLPLGRLARWRTYVGIPKSEKRLARLLRRYRFRRAIDVVNERLSQRENLPRFQLAPQAGGVCQG